MAVMIGSGKLERPDLCSMSDTGKVSPNIARIVKDARGSIRAALQALEMELMLA